MRATLLFVFFFLLAFFMKAQQPAAYNLFDSEGNEVPFDELVNQVLSHDVFFFGELHNDPISHWFRLVLAQAVYETGGKEMIFGAEMFELDNQLLLDEFMAGLISERNFEQEMRLWKNHKTDYKPIFDWSRELGIPWVATNVPRRYANLVHREGVDALQRLPDASKQYLPRLPIEIDMGLETYAALLDMMPAGHGGDNFVAAQAIKDATMGFTIARITQSGQLMFHLNGAYHNEKREGILWYVNQYNPQLTMLTLSTVLQSDISRLDDANHAKSDFILVVDERMTRTH